VKLTRRYRFSASHRLDTPQLTAEQNRQLYGKCNNPYGHGHDYVLDVTVEGAPDASGQLVNREALDALVSDRVLRRFDHRNLNMDVAELSGVVATTENLATTIENSLLAGWNIPARLNKIRISETARNIFELENKTA
jgi:6-pyruvoyltetrahydropterin/6-carboxytetrahydropterin synthase